jgi:hypothetical protein
MMLVFLAMGLLACNSASSPANGMSELVALAGSAGTLSSKLSYELEGATEATFPGKSGFKYVVSGFKLKTSKGSPLKALGIIFSSNPSFKAAQVLSAKGELDLSGNLVDLGAFKAFRAIASFKVPSGTTTLDVQASMLLVDSATLFDEADALFGKLLQLNRLSAVNLSGASLFTYSAPNEDGSTTLGIGLADIRQKPGLLERPTAFGYLAEGLQTPYGRAKRLSGALAGEKNLLINAVALGIKLVQPKPEKTVVVACENCTGDVVVATSESTFAEFEVWGLLPKRPPIPLWLTGRGTIPLPKTPTCAELTAALNTAILGANSYSRHNTFLRGGSDLVLVSNTLSRFKAGSAKHSELRQLYAKYRSQSWNTARTLAGQINGLKCYAK